MLYPTELLTHDALVEPYIAGDKETQMAQEANEQEQMASREENSASTEITDDTSRV